MASHARRIQVRDRDRGPDPGPGPHRPGPAAGQGRGPLEECVQNVAGRTPDAWREQIDVLAMDGFTGYKTATSEIILCTVAIMDPFHVVHLATDALETCRCRIQKAILGHRGRKGDPYTKPDAPSQLHRLIPTLNGGFNNQPHPQLR